MMQREPTTTIPPFLNSIELRNCSIDEQIRSIQSYLNDVHLVPSVVLRGNELLTKVPMDMDT